ncbi:hypothetical protein H5410_042956 [Solanum commersonii]|uniref:Growth-regulating factor n=1 Tax=Solanum commersonii TaxID=4109 RepID=A0A9J5XXH3_SOLCO|nr:hypothetical protein H5410_042956 [Solanum commersonii]
MGYGYGYRPPFTAVQWQELEHQAMIYKYLMAGLPVPPDLVVPIRLGYCSYYGKKFDPEPGRCRRTDGKKWRCSKDAYPDSKYCERHMHRGRNRSRKPVESQSTSQSLSTSISQITTGSSNTRGSFQNSSSGSFQNMPLYSVANSGTLNYGSTATKLQMEPVSYGIDNKDYRYLGAIYLSRSCPECRKAADFHMQLIPLTKTKDSEGERKNSCCVSSISFKPSGPSGLLIFRSELCLDPGYMVRPWEGKEMVGVCVAQTEFRVTGKCMSDYWCRLQSCVLECYLGSCTDPRGEKRGEESYATESQESFVNLQVKEISVVTSSFINDKMYHRYLHGITPDADEHNLSSEASATVRRLGMGTNTDSTWVLPSQVSSGPMARSKNDSQLLGSSTEMHLPNLLEPMIDATISKRRHQHCFFGSDIDSPGTVKEEQHSMRPFFNEWPTAKESWSNLDDEGSNKNSFSTTQLSISIPIAPSNFSSRSACSPNEPTTLNTTSILQESGRFYAE